MPDNNVETITLTIRTCPNAKKGYFNIFEPGSKMGRITSSSDNPFWIFSEWKPPYNQLPIRMDLSDFATDAPEGLALVVEHGDWLGRLRLQDWYQKYREEQRWKQAENSLRRHMAETLVERLSNLFIRVSAESVNFIPFSEDRLPLGTAGCNISVGCHACITICDSITGNHTFWLTPLKDDGVYCLTLCYGKPGYGNVVEDAAALLKFIDSSDKPEEEAER